MMTLKVVAPERCSNVFYVVENLSPAPKPEADDRGVAGDIERRMFYGDGPQPTEHNPWTHGMPRRERRKAAKLARRKW